MKTSRLSSFCFFALFAYCAVAQNAPQPAGTPQPPPSPPFVATHLPEWCQWTVDFKRPPSASNASGDPLDAYRKLAAQDPTVAKAMQNPQFVFSLNEPRPLRKVIVKTGPVSHEVDTLERGYRHEIWTMGESVVEKFPGSPKLVAHTEDPNSPANLFPEFDWLSTSNFKRRQKLNGVDCLIFEAKLNPLDVLVPGVGAEASESAKVEATAVIAEQSRLPMALSMGSESRLYTFLSPPTAILVPAPPFVAAAQELKAQLRCRHPAPLSPP